MLKEIQAFIESRKSELRSLSDDIWNHPETAYHEKYAAARACRFLSEHGFQPVAPCYGLETAFRCEFGNQPGPVFAFASEYDALPEIGHGCGHNLICTAGIAAFMALAERMKAEKLPGRAVLLGTPAEEGGGGKVNMIEAGCLKGIDAVVMTHPSKRNIADAGSTANCGMEVTFHGKSAHAAAAPEKGINALDAVQLLFTAVSYFRQQLPEHARIHGVILDGGTVPNVIPDMTRCRFYLRSGDESWSPVLDKRFRDMVKGAELMTGCTAEITPFRPFYRARKPNRTMNEEYVRCMKEMGLKVAVPEHQGRGSSDFGNFSQVIPGLHPYFAVSDTSEPAGHSKEFCVCAGQDAGFNNAMAAAASLAQIGYRFLTEPEFRDSVKKDFDNNTKGF